ncbi:MAG: transporter substrate-binding domain-containing protein [Candidatus Delongbacteria bacterium]|nr:transporter substrate-binding domain-containing protein [Candidatus Delongbacteria bacterium]MBN2836650.1 transporter substrate-binding domain-containing protein [Candidatus Delongbacteria bacterium]
MKPIIVIFMMLALSLTIYSEVIELTFAYEDKEQPPYYMGNSNEVLNENPGVAVEMVKLLETRIYGIEIDFVRYPWKRCLASLGENKVDGIFNSSYKQDRLEVGWYPTVDNKHDGEPNPDKRICDISYSLYTLKGTVIPWDGENFNNFTGKISAPLGYSIVDDLKKKGVNIEESPSSINNIDKVVNLRVEATALQDVTADNIIASSPDKYKDIVKISPALTSKHYYVMLSDKLVEENPELAKKIWDELEKIREEKFVELSKKYND